MIGVGGGGPIAELIMMKERRDRAERAVYTSRCPIMLMNINAPLGVVAINAGHSGSLNSGPAPAIHAARCPRNNENKRPVAAPPASFSSFPPSPPLRRASVVLCTSVVASNHPLPLFFFLCFSRGRDHEWHRAPARHKRIIKIK